LADAADVAVKQVPLVSRPQLDEAQRGVDGFLTLPRHRFLVPVLVAAIRLNESAAHGALMAADRIIHDSTRVGSLLLVTPFYRNGDATRLVAEFHGKNQLVPPKLVVGYLVQACEGLLALHEAGIIHRSVRPENLLLSDDYRSIALTDFGGSVLNPRRDAFSSPEVGFAGGVWQATPAADAWSLGFVAIFLAAARSDTDRILADHGAAGLPSFNVAVRRATAHMDPRFPEVVLALTVQDPKGRLSVADARARLVEILRDLSS
jgi:serine/threonine protein kinase